MSNSREETYCVKERKYTENINPILKSSKNGNNYIQSTCFVCGNKKSSFIKSLQNNQQNNQNKKNGNGSNNEKSKKSNKKNNNVNIKDFFYKKNKK